MLAKRLIGKILTQDGLAIQSKGFQHYLPLGRPEILAEFLDQWGIDEIILIDRLASLNEKTISHKLIEKIVKNCRTPLTVGGGIRSLDDALRLVNSGADRVCINLKAMQDIEIVNQLSSVLGVQAVVVSIDYLTHPSYSSAYVYDYSTNTITDTLLIDWCKELELAGAGELLIHSVSLDGTGNGYDENIYKKIINKVRIPIVASGGYGKPEHFKKVLSTGVQGAAIGNRLNYIEHAVALIKSYCSNTGLRPSEIVYPSEKISTTGRPLKPLDTFLEDLQFIHKADTWL